MPGVLSGSLGFVSRSVVCCPSSTDQRDVPRQFGNVFSQMQYARRSRSARSQVERSQGARDPRHEELELQAYAPSQESRTQSELPLFAPVCVEIVRKQLVVVRPLMAGVGAEGSIFLV